MNICINSEVLLISRFSGISHYTYSLIKSLLKLNEPDKFYKLFYLTGINDNIPNLFNEFTNISNIIVRFPGFLRKIFKFCSIYLNYPVLENFVKIPIDIYHTPNYFAFPSKKARIIYTVYDLIPFLYPEFLPQFYKSNFIIIAKCFFRKLFEKADLIITISENTKNDLINYMNIKEEKIKVVYLASRENFYPIKDKTLIKPVLDEYKINSPYILFIGTLEPKKNLPLLIEAYSKLPDKIKKDYLLVLAGNKGWKYDNIFKKIKELNLYNRVIHTDYIPEEKLPLLLNGATLLVYPSLYEGFGLPPLEAMSCGIPVITSNNSSLPEIIGDAGIMIDPKDVNQLTESMSFLLENPQQREKLSKLGIKRSKNFSWDKVAYQTMEVYKSLV